MILFDLITMRVRLWKARTLATRAAWHREQSDAHATEGERLACEAVEILDNVIAKRKPPYVTRQLGDLRRERAA